MSSSGERQTLGVDGQTPERGTVGSVRLSLTGTFGGGTAKLQAKDPSGTFVDVDGGSFTAVTDTIFDFPANVQNQLRVDLSGSTAPALVIWLQSELDR